MYNKHPKIDLDEELSLDPDNDGLSTAQEYAIGSDPYLFDTDGDGTSDSVEAKQNSNPRIPANSPEELQQKYYHHASQILGWDKDSNLSWDTLKFDILGQFEVGWALDNIVYERAIRMGETPENARLLLAQSPFLQYHREQKKIELKDMVEYSEQVQQQHNILNSKSFGRTHSVEEPKAEFQYSTELDGEDD